MAKRRNYGTFTARRRTALRKAQAASARKRKGRNKKVAMSVGAIALAGSAFYIGHRVNTNKKPMGTDISKEARDVVESAGRRTTPTRGVKKAAKKAGRKSTASPAAQAIHVGDQMALFPVEGMKGTNVATTTRKASGTSTSGRSAFDPSKWVSGQKTIEYFQSGKASKHDFLPEWPQLSPDHQGQIGSLLKSKGLGISSNGVVYDRRDSRRGRRKKK